MKIFAKPMNYGTLESAEYGAVFDLKGELYIKIKLESNNAEVIAVHLGTGNAVTLSGDITVLIINGYFVKDYEI